MHVTISSIQLQGTSIDEPLHQLMFQLHVQFHISHNGRFKLNYLEPLKINMSQFSGVSGLTIVNI